MLTNIQKEALLRYQYHGGDPSVLYRLVLSPMAEYFVQEWTPIWMAPNMITFLGLIISAIATILVLIFNPNLNSNGPRWLHFLSGIAILCYQTLDNMDGKQARKTKSSSPLGLLFDHGCDAINASFLSIVMGSVFASGWTLKLFLGYFIGFIPFYFQTWEEYYTGSMILPNVNGPSEGLVVISIFSFVASYYGSEFWQIAGIEMAKTVSNFILQRVPVQILSALDITVVQSTIYITPFQVVVVVGTIWSILTLIVQAYSVIKAALKRNISINRVLLDLVPISVFFFSIFLWCVISDIALQQYPLLTVLLLTCIFVDTAVHVMVMHISDGQTQPLQQYLALGTPILPLSVVLSSAEYIDGMNIEKMIVIMYSVISTWITCYKLCKICIEVSDALNIHVFILGCKNKSL